jgi:hypothetical protein
MEVRHFVYDLEVENLQNAGCTNGQYPRWWGRIDGHDVSGVTCNCRRGCSNTDCLETDSNGGTWLVEESPAEED